LSQRSTKQYRDCIEIECCSIMPLNLLTCFNLVTSSAAVHGRVTGGVNGALASRNRKRIGPNWTRFKRQCPIEFQRRRFTRGRCCGEFEQRRSHTFPSIDLAPCRCLWPLNQVATWFLMLFALVIASPIKLISSPRHCEHSTCTMHSLCLAETLTRKK